MNPLEKVKADLRLLQEAADGGDAEAMASVLLRLDETVRREGDRLPARLAHFLQQRSYEKARACLEGVSKEEGE